MGGLQGFGARLTCSYRDLKLNIACCFTCYYSRYYYDDDYDDDRDESTHSPAATIHSGSHPLSRVNLDRK